MSLNHNKKRNVGLLNEFFARYMARAIIEHRDADVAKAKELFTKHFHKGTDLHRELKVFYTLFETRLNSREAAVGLIEQAKKACRMQSQAKIDLEKSALLHEVNLDIRDPMFFNQEISEYRDFATIQVLLNHWRGNVLTEDLGSVAQLEDKLISHLTRTGTVYEKKEVLKMTNSDVDNLVIRLMTEKMNKKFSSALSGSQKTLLKLYVFSKDSTEAKQALTTLLEGMRSRALVVLESALRTDTEAQKVGSKLQEVRTLLQEDFKDTSNPTDKMVTFYMTVSKLEEELSNG